MNELPQTFRNKQVILSDDKIINRTWKERLFTKPWRPLVKTRTVKSVVKHDQVLQLGHTLVMRTKTYNHLKQKENINVTRR